MPNYVEPPVREYRSIGRFTANQVRELVPGPYDALAAGCPVALFERVLEKRAAFRAARPVIPAVRPVVRVTPTMTKAEAIAYGRKVTESNQAAKLPVVTDADRRAKIEAMGAVIKKEQEDRAYLEECARNTNAQ